MNFVFYGELLRFKIIVLQIQGGFSYEERFNRNVIEIVQMGPSKKSFDLL